MRQLVFEKRFKESIRYANGLSNRKPDIYHALCTSNATIKELVARFGFSSKSSFNDFCKKNLGAPPGRRIRRDIRLGMDEESENI